MLRHDEMADVLEHTCTHAHMHTHHENRIRVNGWK